MILKSIYFLYLKAKSNFFSKYKIQKQYLRLYQQIQALVKALLLLGTHMVSVLEAWNVVKLLR